MSIQQEWRLDCTGLRGPRPAARVGVAVGNVRAEAARPLQQHVSAGLLAIGLVHSIGRRGRQSKSVEQPERPMLCHIQRAQRGHHRPPVQIERTSHLLLLVGRHSARVRLEPLQKLSHLHHAAACSVFLSRSGLKRRFGSCRRF